METLTENSLRRNFALHFTSYLFIALSKILPHSKTIKNSKKLLVFGENDSHRSSNFLQTHIFWNFDHVYKIWNQINYKFIWFPKVIIILIMTAQVLFLTFFPKKSRTLMSLRKPLANNLIVLYTSYVTPPLLSLPPNKSKRWTDPLFFSSVTLSRITTSDISKSPNARFCII